MGPRRGGWVGRILVVLLSSNLIPPKAYDPPLPYGQLIGSRGFLRGSQILEIKHKNKILGIIFGIILSFRGDA